jgi:hypothetical protein
MDIRAGGTDTLHCGAEEPTAAERAACTTEYLEEESYWDWLPEELQSKIVIFMQPTCEDELRNELAKWRREVSVKWMRSRVESVTTLESLAHFQQALNHVRAQLQHQEGHPSMVAHAHRAAIRGFLEDASAKALESHVIAYVCCCYRLTPAQAKFAVDVENARSFPPGSSYPGACFARERLMRYRERCDKLEVFVGMDEMDEMDEAERVKVREKLRESGYYERANRVRDFFQELAWLKARDAGRDLLREAATGTVVWR